MMAKAVRLYGKGDLRLEEIELPSVGRGELLARVVTDSLCMSSHKTALLGAEHWCVPNDIDQNPVIIGHELSGVVIEAGEGLEGRYQAGDRFAVQPRMDIGGRVTAPGYSYGFYGGSADHILVPAEVIEGGYLLPYDGEAHFKASLAEPYSCLIAALDAFYHLRGKEHIMGLRDNGRAAILAGGGPMGLAAAELMLARSPRPRTLVLTDIDLSRVERVRQLLGSTEGTEVLAVHTGGLEDEAAHLLSLTGGQGFDDIMIMAPVASVVETADRIAGADCCLHFFAGPPQKDFSVVTNFYDVHYKSKHYIGTSGGGLEDMKTALSLIEQGSVNPARMITHIGGLNCVAEAILRLPAIPGGKKLIYCGLDLPLTALEELPDKAKHDPLMARLYEICQSHGMLWCREAEEALLQWFDKGCRHQR